MPDQLRKAKSKKGSVQFKNTKGKLQIVFSYPVEIDGEIQRKRFYISTGYDDTPLNRHRVGDTVRSLQRDIDYGEVDLSLHKYKPVASLTTISRLSPNSSPNTPIQTQPNLAELWEKYAAFKKSQVSPSTYLKDFGKVRNHIAKLPTTSLEDATAIRDWLLANLTPNAAKRCLTQIKACCCWAYDEGVIEDNPFMQMRVKVPKSQGESHDINPFSKAERDLIIKTFAADPHYGHYTNFVRFMFFTGTRPSEAIALKWKRITDSVIQLRDAVVVSEQGLVLKEGLKTQRKRDFPLTPDVQEILMDAKPEHCDPEGLIFPSPNGKFIDQHNFANRAWKAILNKCGVPYRKPYQCRHTFISLCAEENMNSLAIARWTGTSMKMIENHYGATNLTNIRPPTLQ